MLFNVGEEETLSELRSSEASGADRPGELEGDQV